MSMTRKGLAVASAVFCLVILAVTSLRATPQASDLIDLEGKSYRLLVTPLEGYFETQPRHRPAPTVTWSSNWRGYVARFVIVRRQLIVQDVTIATGRAGGSRSVLGEVFPHQDPVAATWFTGNLVLADGELTGYAPVGIGADDEHFIVIRVDAGVTAAPRRLDARQFAEFRRAQFEAFTRTDRYREVVDDAKKTEPRMNAAEFERFAFAFFSADYLVRVAK
jgi:hypothetical protein